MGRSKRNRETRPFIMLLHEIIDSKKWKSLPFSAQSLYTRLRRKYKKHNNGEIYLPYRELADEFSKGTIAKGFKSLVSVGAIRVTKRGGLYREYCWYEIVLEPWWRDQNQPHFLKHFTPKNEPDKLSQLPPHVQKIDLPPQDHEPPQVQKTDPFLDSTIRGVQNSDG